MPFLPHRYGRDSHRSQAIRSAVSHVPRPLGYRRCAGLVPGRVSLARPGLVPSPVLRVAGGRNVLARRSPARVLRRLGRRSDRVLKVVCLG